MNNAFINFYEAVLDFIDSDYYYTVNTVGKETSLRQINVVPNAINIYFVPVYTLGAGISSFTFSPTQGIIIANNAATGSTLPHEVGHYFDLFHTHQTGYFDENGYINDGSKENILREPGFPCFNANVRGDLIFDTEADHNLLDLTGYHVSENCEYAPQKTFNDDCDYSNYSPDVHNVMSYSRWACRDYFSP